MLILINEKTISIDAYLNEISRDIETHSSDNTIIGTHIVPCLNVLKIIFPSHRDFPTLSLAPKRKKRSIKKR